MGRTVASFVAHTVGVPVTASWIFPADGVAWRTGSRPRFLLGSVGGPLRRRDAVREIGYARLHGNVYLLCRVFRQRPACRGACSVLRVASPARLRAPRDCAWRLCNPCAVLGSLRAASPATILSSHESASATCTPPDGAACSPFAALSSPAAEHTRIDQHSLYIAVLAAAL